MKLTLAVDVLFVCIRSTNDLNTQFYLLSKFRILNFEYVNEIVFQIYLYADRGFTLRLFLNKGLVLSHPPS